MRAGRLRALIWMSAIVVAGFTAACGGKKYVTVTVPPRLDLARFERTALATFTVENAKGSLHELATRRFAERVLAAQEVEVLELGSPASVMQQAGEHVFGPESAKAIGTSHDVPAVFAGHLKVSNAKPSGGVGTFGLPVHVEATVAVELTVGLYSTRTGGTIWRSGAAASEKVGQLSVSGGMPSFSAKDPEAAYGRLVDHLISVVTQDLYPTYERRQS